MRPRATPPRVAGALLHLVRDRDAREAIDGDLAEAFVARAARDGAGAARRWYWRQALAAVVGAPRLPRSVTPTSSVASAPGDPLVRSFLADLRHGARLLARAPGFTALAVLTLALGIGATTAIFSVVNPVLLRPLPYPAPERLVMVWERGADGTRMNTSFATYTDLARDARTLERAAALAGWEPTVSDGGAAERLTGLRVSSTYFRTLGVRPAIGRDFDAAEDVPEGPRTVLLAHALWRRRFGGDPAIVGRQILLDDQPHLVAGVMPAGFDDVLQPHAQIWRVLRYGPEQPWACRTCRHVRMVARVRSGVAADAARAELDRLSAALVTVHPRDYPATGTFVDGVNDEVTRRFRPALLAMAGAAALVLLITGANVVGLQLARALRREGEFAIRAALGAGGGRLVRQLVAEGALLAALGGAAGLAVAAVAVPVLRARLPEELPRLAAVRLDLAALAASAAVALALGMLGALAPAWTGRRAAATASLRAGTRTVGARRHAARAAFVVVEVALALVLLAGAGLLSRSLERLMAVDPGFRPEQLLTLQVQTTGKRYERDEAVWAAHDRLRAAVAAVPGVTSVELASQLPLSGNLDSYGVRAQDHPLENPELSPNSDRYAVSPGFLQTMGIRLVRGRALTRADDSPTAPKVAVVSATLAARLWPGEDALGKRLQVGATDGPWREVVGIVGDVRHGGLDATDLQQLYIPERQWPWADHQMALVARTTGDPAAVAAAVRRAAAAVDPTQPVTKLATMEQVVATSTAQRRLARLLFAAFAAAALVLAAAGIYGVLAARVAERTREIGVRSALGAMPRDIVRLVVRHGLALALAGLVIGLAGALVLGRFLERLLYGVRPSDPVTLGAVVAILAAVAGIACSVPAVRALRVAPTEALRAE